MTDNDNQTIDAQELQNDEYVEEVYGGEISDEGAPSPISFDQKKHQAETTRWLAIAFIAIFALAFFGHYFLSAFFHGKGMVATAEFLASIFDKWSSGITALTGSVITYYFTKEK